MKAALLTAYDKEGRDVEIRDLPVPQIGANDVLVKIRTAGVNPLDNMIIKGEVKMIVPYKMPLVMGNEFVGTVEKVGASVKKFTVGERVYGRMPLDTRRCSSRYLITISLVCKAPEQVYSAYRIEANSGKDAESLHDAEILRGDCLLADSTDHHHKEGDSCPDPDAPMPLFFNPAMIRQTSETIERSTTAAVTIICIISWKDAISFPLSASGNIV